MRTDSSQLSATPARLRGLAHNSHLSAGALETAQALAGHTEGMAAAYAKARYAELRVGSSGASLIVGLRGPDREVLGAARQP